MRAHFNSYLYLRAHCSMHLITNVIAVLSVTILISIDVMFIFHNHPNPTQNETENVFFSFRVYNKLNAINSQKANRRTRLIAIKKILISSEDNVFFFG